MSADSESGSAPRSPTQANAGERAGRDRLRKRSVVIAGHRTSVSLEDAFWEALSTIARRRGESLSRLITRIDRQRSGNLSSAIRVFVLGELESRASRAGPTARERDPHRE